MQLIFAGKKRSGKDRAADWFRSQYGGTKLVFAEPLYEIMWSAQDKLNIPRHKDRKFLTTVGDYYRSINPLIFIETLVTKYQNIPNVYKTNTYVSDGRYVNELDALASHGFIRVEIQCDDYQRIKRLDPGDLLNDSHSSENGYPKDYPFEVSITNNGTLEEFYDKLALVAKAVIKGDITRESRTVRF